MPALIAKLVTAGNSPAPREIPLTSFPVRLGRRAGNGICLQDRWVSREHCEIDRENDVLTVRDLNSKHGTFVNGQPIRAAHLQPGDELSVGLTRFVVRYEPEAAPLALARSAAG